MRLVKIITALLMMEQLRRRVSLETYKQALVAWLLPMSPAPSHPCPQAFFSSSHWPSYFLLQFLLCIHHSFCQEHPPSHLILLLSFYT